MRRWLRWTAFLLALTPCVLAAQGLPADVRPAALREVGFDQRLGESLPLDVELRDENGRAVTLATYFKDRPVVLSVVYYECPMLCTLTLNGLVSALATLSFDVGREFEVVTVSFDPREGPELARAKKAAYLRRYERPGAAEGWHFLTGDEEALRAVTSSIGFRYAWDERTQQFAHPAGLVVLTPEGRISRYIYGVEYAPKDLRLALVESAAGRIGSAVDQVLLFCYEYDPETGRYGAVIMRLVRLGGVLTLAGLGGLIFVLRRSERRRDAQRPRPAPVGEWR
ncbi:MAG TPA: SCO family protein [Longimicrobiales bacterium]|nr:SCO family protein [Longimicrobiales bacterium]